MTAYARRWNDARLSVVPRDEVAEHSPTDYTTMMVAFGSGRMNNCRAPGYSDAKVFGSIVFRLHGDDLVWLGLAWLYLGDCACITHASAFFGMPQSVMRTKDSRVRPGRPDADASTCDWVDSDSLPDLAQSAGVVSTVDSPIRATP